MTTHEVDIWGGSDVIVLAIVWAAGSAIAFSALRVFALRDFGEITVGGLIGLALFSLIAPSALLMAFCLSLQGKGRFLGKVVWKSKG